MKLSFKKIISLFTLMCCALPVSAASFGGYTHAYLAMRVLTTQFCLFEDNKDGDHLNSNPSKNQNTLPLSNQEVKAYILGSCYADFGWLNLDKTFIKDSEQKLVSDEKIFVDALVEKAAKSNNRTWKFFALGMSDHYIQDKGCSVLKIMLDENGVPLPLDYKTLFSMLDNHFYGDTKEIVRPDFNLVPLELLAEIYEEIAGVQISANTLEKEFTKLWWIFYLGTWWGYKGITFSQNLLALEHFNILTTKKCGKSNPYYKTLFA